MRWNSAMCVVCLKADSPTGKKPRSGFSGVFYEPLDGGGSRYKFDPERGKQQRKKSKSSSSSSENGERTKLGAVWSLKIRMDFFFFFYLLYMVPFFISLFDKEIKKIE